MEELEVVKKYFEYGISAEIVGHPDLIEIDSERESLSSTKQQRILETSPGSRKKTTYQSLDGKLPI